MFTTILTEPLLLARELMQLAWARPYSSTIFSPMLGASTSPFTSPLLNAGANFKRKNITNSINVLNSSLKRIKYVINFQKNSDQNN